MSIVHIFIFYHILCDIFYDILCISYQREVSDRSREGASAVEDFGSRSRQLQALLAMASQQSHTLKECKALKEQNAWYSRSLSRAGGLQNRLHPT